MFSSPRKILLSVSLLLFLAFLPAPTQSQEPTPHSHGFLEMYTHEQYTAPSQVSKTENVAVSGGLARWYGEQITTSSSALTNLLFDSKGTPHVIFNYAVDEYANALKYGYYNGVNWQFQTVDVQRYLTDYFSFDVDAMGHVHISYCVYVPGMACDDLLYAHYDGFLWKYEVVDSLGLVGQFSSIQADDEGHPHISYVDYTNSALKYAYHDGFAWHTETVDNSVIGATSLALDNGGHPQIAYIANEGTKYAYYDGTSWRKLLVGGHAFERRYISLMIDAIDRSHIIYHDQNGDLVHAYRDAGIWHAETVSSCNYMESSYFSSAIDELDRPNVIYLDCSTLQPVYAYYDGRAWQYEVPPALGALALDSENRPHITYYVPEGIVYATRVNDPSGWSALTFASYRDMNFEVYTAQGGGTNPIRRTVHGATDYMPEFNRGATQMAFVSTRDGNPEIYTMRADGTNQVRLTVDAASDYLPTWSPDGMKIAFYSNRDGNSEIYVMNANGTTQTRLTANNAWDGHPTWSPDGAKIAFVSDRGGSDELWTMNADGSNQKQLSNGLGVAGYPDWSPDGRRIALNDDANRDGWLDVAIINADGTGLFHPLGYSPTSFDQLAPVWSPDGMYLAFAKLQWINYYGNWYWVDSYINYILNLDGSRIYTLIDSGYDWWPDWQTADIAAPSSSAFAPAWSDTITFTVRWNGSDKGPAGLRYYDVQYRDDTTGVWTDWLTTTLKVSATFIGEYAHTYYFRSRAYDYAGNIELYPNDADAMTHIFRYALSGRVLGNREQPIFAAVVQSTLPAVNVAATNHNGNFTLYFDDAGTFAVTASRNDFGVLPPANNISVPSSMEPLIFYLPPVDNVVVDGDFEVGDLAVWSPSGEIMPVLTSTNHTGDGAVMLGGAFASTMIAPSWRSIVEQKIELPSPLTATTLSLLYQVAEAEPISDTLEVYLIGTTQKLTYTLPLTVSGWEHRWWDLSAWDNPTLTLQVVWHQSEMTRAAGIILDEISLGTAIQGVHSVYLPMILRSSR